MGICWSKTEVDKGQSLTLSLGVEAANNPGKAFRRLAVESTVAACAYKTLRQFYLVTLT
jgi:hypothetical protein